MRRLIPLILLLLAAPASASEFVVTPGEPNLIRFTSKAPMETFHGTTREVSGTITVAPDNPASGFEVAITVDMASLDTGKDKRNAHMRENHLETETYPTATFAGATIVDTDTGPLVDGEKRSYVVEGDFTLHGVTKRITITTHVTYTSADGALHVTGTFKVLLADYKIDRPKFLILKLNEEQVVDFDLTAKIPQP